MKEEIVTNPLSLAQLEESIPEIADFLLPLGTPVNVEYGWGCNLPTINFGKRCKWTCRKRPTCELISKGTGVLPSATNQIFISSAAVDSYSNMSR